MILNHANKSLITLTFPGVKDAQLTLLSLKIEEAVSRMDTLTLVCSIPAESDPGVFLNQPLHLSWDSIDQEQHYHGLVTSLILKSDSEEQSLLTLTCHDLLITLQYTRQSRHFTEQSLSFIVKFLLSDNKIPLVNTVFHASVSETVREYRAQHDESDYSFFERILHDSGCFYLLEHSASGVILHVHDHSQALQAVPHSVPFYPLSQGVKPVDSIYEIQASEQVITALQTIETHARMLPSQSLKSSKSFAQTTSLGYSIEKALAVDSQSELDHYARHRFEQNQQAQSKFFARSDRADLRPGLLFTLSEHPNNSINQSYLIVSVVHEVDEQSQTLRYFNKLELLPAQFAYRAPYEPNDILMNTLGFSQIHSDNEAPLLTQQGEYFLKSPYNDALTHPVRASTLYSGADYGMHFPLHTDSQVIIAHLNGHPDKPVILGALFNDEQRNVVNAENALQNRIVTHAGHELLLDDTPDQHKILLHTPEQRHRLLLDASTGNEKIELVSETGEMFVEINKGTQFKTEDNFNLSAEQSIQIRAKEDISFYSEQKNLTCEASQDIKHRAGQDISWHAEKTLSLRTDDNFETVVGQSMRTDIQAGDYQLKVEAGKATHQVQGNIQFNSSSGNIILQTAKASLSLMADGTIILDAKKIILQAQSIDIHQSGETNEN